MCFVEVQHQCKVTIKGWFEVARISRSVITRWTLFFLTISSLLRTFIAYSSSVPRRRTRYTLPTLPRPMSLISLKSLREMGWPWSRRYFSLVFFFCACFGLLLYANGREEVKTKRRDKPHNVGRERAKKTFLPCEGFLIPSQPCSDRAPCCSSASVHVSLTNKS